MLSLVCDIKDDTAVAVQRDLNGLERHIPATIQLRNTHYQTSIKSFFHHYKMIQTQLWHHHWRGTW